MKDQEMSTPASEKSYKIFIMLFAAVLMLIFTALIVLPYFYVEEIKIEGNHYLSSETILQTTAIKKGDHLFKNWLLHNNLFPFIMLRYGGLEKKMTYTSPFIESIKIKMSFPSTIYVQVKERMVIGYLEIPDGYAIIDANGWILNILKKEDLPNVPFIQGIPVEKAKIGQKIKFKEEKSFQSCILVLGAILSADKSEVGITGYSLMQHVQSIRSLNGQKTLLSLSIPNKTSMQMSEIVVVLSSLTSVVENMEWLRFAVANNDAMSKNGSGILDMSGTDFTFRKPSTFTLENYLQTEETEENNIVEKEMSTETTDDAENNKGTGTPTPTEGNN